MQVPSSRRFTARFFLQGLALALLSFQQPAASGQERTPAEAERPTPAAPEAESSSSETIDSSAPDDGSPERSKAAPPSNPLPAPAPGTDGRTGVGPAATPVGAAAPPSLEEVRDEIHRLEADREMDPAVRGRLVERYQAAAKDLEEARASAAQAKTYREKLLVLPGNTAELRASFASLPPDPRTAADIGVASDIDAAGAERLLTSASSELASSRASLTEIEQNLRREESRPAVARRELDETRDALALLEAQPRPQAGESEPLLGAQRVAREARELALRSRRDKLEQEILSYDERVEWLAASRDWAQRRVSNLEARVRLLEELLQERREAEAEAAREEALRAEEATRGKHPLVVAAAKRNAELGSELTDVTEILGRETRHRQQSRERLRKVSEDFRDARYQLEKGGLTEGLGEILRDQKRSLPNPFELRRRLKETERAIGAAALAQYRFGEERKSLSDPDRAVSRLIIAAAETKTPPPSDEATAELRALVRDRGPLLERLIAANRELLDSLGEIESLENQLLAITREYEDFLGEHLLWIPSAPPLGPEALGELLDASVWLLSPASWRDVTAATVALLLDRAVLGSLVVFASSLLIGFRRRLFRSIDDLAGNVGKVTTDSFALTLRALAMTVLLALPIPLVLGFLGWQLRGRIDATDFAQAFGEGVFALARLLFVFEFVLLLVRPRSVAEVHFRWRERTLQILRRNIWWFAPVALTSAFLTAMTNAQPIEGHRNGLGRLAFIVGMVALTIFFRRVIRTRGGVFDGFLAEYPDGWMSRLRGLWHPLTLAVPFSLAVLAAVGYYYTVLELDERLTASLWLVIGAIVVHQSVIRWLLIEQRRLAIEKVRERRKAAAQAAKDGGASSADFVLSPVELTGHEVDISTVNEQTRHLVRTILGFGIVVGLWMIWAGVLPALAFLNAKELWAYTIDGTSYPVTLGMLALAAVLISVTAVAARNLPGVLEIVILKNLPLDPGSRYAVTTVCQYLIAAAGIVIAFNTIGVGWAQVQWLVAAVGVGLGFGLQEVFANFVCGLVLLFERPIRVGDIVTIGDVSGVVSRIRIRATTITNWDRKELVVPNKEFITGRVLNWTLSSAVNRVVVNVGVSYDADTEKARGLLVQVAQEHPLILDDPPPMATFEEFGSSTLNLVLRCFLPDLERRLPVIHELHTRILETFRREGIEIAYPQQDIHLRSADAVLRVGGNGTGTVASPAPGGRGTITATPPDSDLDRPRVEDGRSAAP